MNIPKPSAGTILLGGILASILAFLTFFQLVTYEHYFDSDAAGLNLLAKLAFDGITFFPLLHGHYLMIPLLFLFKNGYMLHAATGLIFSAAFLVLLIKFLLKSHYDAKAILFVATLIFSGMSFLGAVSLFGHYGYGIHAALLLLWFVIAASMLIDADTRLGWRVGLVVLSIFISFMTHRAVVYYYAPMVLAVIAYFLLEGRLRERCAGIATFFGIVGVSTVVGLKIAVFFRGADALKQSVPTDVSIATNLARNWQILKEGYYFLIGYSPGGLGGFAPTLTANAQQFSAYIFILAGVVSLLVLVSYRRIRLPYVKFLALYHFFMTALVLVPLLYGSLLVDVFSCRYVIVPVLTSFILSGYYIHILARRSSFAASIVTICLCSIVSFNSYRYLIEPQRTIARDDAGWHIVWDGNQYSALAKHLVDRGIQHALANFWVAGVTSVLSGYQVNVLDVDYLEHLPIPGNVNGKFLRHYSGHMPKSALVLKKEELAQLDQSLLASLVGEPASKHEFQGYTLFEYDYDITTRLPYWGSGFPVMSSTLRPGQFNVRIVSAVLELKAHPGDRIELPVTILNRSNADYSSFGPYPILAGGLLFAADGITVLADCGRMRLPLIKSGHAGQVAFPFVAPATAGEYFVVVDLVEQAGSGWFAARDGSVAAMVKLTVTGN